MITEILSYLLHLRALPQGSLMKTCLFVLLMTGSWWLCITIVAIEETQAEQRNRKEGSSSVMPAKSLRPVEGRQKQAETKTLSSVKPAAGRKPHRVIKSSKKVPSKILVASNFS